MFFNGGAYEGFKIADSASVSTLGREVSRLGALLLMALPSLVSLILSRLKRWSLTNTILVSMKHVPLDWLVFLIPFAVLKMFHPWYLLAPFSSGDGRNNLLLTISARMSALKPLTFIDVGVLPNTFASLISSGNGAIGKTDVADLWAISFVYVTAIGLVVWALSRAVDINNLPIKWGRTFRSMIFLGALLFAINPAFLSFCLNDGFFSLYFAVALLVAGITFLFSCESRVLSVACVCILTMLLALSYVILLPTWLAFSLPFTFYNQGFTLGNRYARRSIAALVVVGGLFMVVYGSDIWSTYLKSVKLHGAFIPMSPMLLVSLVIFQTCIALFSSVRRSQNWKFVALMGSLTLFQYSIIEIANSSFFMDDDSYYGTKILVATTALSVTFTCLLIINEILRNSLLLRNLTICLFLTTTVMFSGSVLLSHQTRLTNAIPSILNRWGYPDAEELRVAVNHWNGPSFLFLEYSNSPKYARGTWRSESQEANDRLLNFWSPIFWNINAKSDIADYNWIYENWNPADLASMCPEIKKSIQIVITRSPSLKDRLISSCGWAPTVEFR